MSQPFVGVSVEEASFVESTCNEICNDVCNVK